MTHLRARRYRWQRLFWVVVFAVYGVWPWLMNPSASSSADRITGAVAFALSLLLEFLVLPRFALPASQICQKCEASVAAEGRACACCGHDWFVREPTLYAPTLLGIAYTKKMWRIALAVTIAAGVVASIPLLYFEVRIGMVIYFLCMAYVFEIVRGIIVKRTYASLKEHAGSLCLRCAYPLDESMGACPECGTPGTAEESRLLWSRAGLWFSPSPRDGGAAA